MPERVVYRLQTIDVDLHHRQAAPVTKALAPQLLADREETAPIVEARQLVAQCQISETLVHPLTFDALTQRPHQPIRRQVESTRHSCAPA